MAFTDNIVKLGKNRTSQFVRTVVMEVGARLVERSPVGNPSLWQGKPPPGYVGGRFRGNWQYGYNSAPPGVLERIDKDGTATRAGIETGALINPAVGVHYLVNNLPYAEPLENGHSTQAPLGIVGLTRMEIPGIMDKAARS